MFFTALFIRECVCQNKHCMCSKSCHIHMLRKICTETPYSVQRTDCVIGCMFMCVRGACQLESRLRTLFVCVCVCIRGGGGQSPLAGRFGAAPVVCVCVCQRMERTGPALQSGGNTLSFSLSFSSSLPLLPHSPHRQHPGTQTSPPFFSHLQLFHSVRPSVPPEPSPCVWEFQASLRIFSAPPATSASVGRRER